MTNQTSRKPNVPGRVGQTLPSSDETPSVTHEVVTGPPQELTAEDLQPIDESTAVPAESLIRPRRMQPDRGKRV